MFRRLETADNNPTMFINKVCCTCLSFDVEMLSLADDEEIRESLEKVANIRIEVEDVFLQNVCEECVSLLRKFVQFKVICVEANKRLRQMLKQYTHLNKDLLLKESQELYSVTKSEFDDIQDGSDSDHDLENTSAKYQSDTDLNNDSDAVPLVNSRLLKTKEYDTDDILVIDDTSSVKSESTEIERVEEIIIEKDSFRKDLKYLIKSPDRLENSPENSQLDNIYTYELELETCPQLGRANENDLGEKIAEVRSESMESRKVEEKSVEEKDPKDALKSVEKIRVRKTKRWKSNYAVKIVLTEEQQMEESLKRKCSETYLKAKFQCCHCVIGFKTNEKFKEHMKLHDEIRGDIVCDRCNLRYSNLKQLRVHRASHIIRYKCLRCEEIFKTSKRALIHTNLNHDSVFECETCYEKFQKEELYNNHIHSAHPTPHVCEFCRYYFTSGIDLKYHKRISKECRKKKTILECKICDAKYDKFQSWYNHTVAHAALGKEEPPPTECQICGHETASWFDWKAHVCREHRKLNRDAAKAKKEVKRTYMCELCGKIFTSNHILTVHKYRLHPDTRKEGEFPFNILKWKQKCEICDRTFLSTNMKRHMLVHTGEKPFKCDQCEKAFTQAVTRDMHVRIIHQKLVNPRRLRMMSLREQPKKKSYKQKPKLKTLSCRQCSRKFPNNFQLTIHERTHTGEKPFSCDVCQAKFTSKIYLKIHTITHTGVKPYICNICNKGFSKRSNMNRHQVVHTGEKNYKCDLCEKSFTYFVGLTSHRNTIHLNLPNPPRKPRKRTKKQ